MDRRHQDSTPGAPRRPSIATRAAAAAGPIAAALLLAAFVALVATAQGGRSRPKTAAGEPPPTFAETIAVRVVNLEAVVVDRDGNRVSGLAPGDFRLRVDGREVPIGYFSEVADGQAVEEAAGEAGRPAGPTPPALPAGVEPGQPVGTSYLVFVDDYLTFRPSDRNLVLDDVAKGLERLGPADRMAIVAFDGRNLDLLANWTGSHETLARALEDAKRRPARGLHRRTVAGAERGAPEEIDPTVPRGSAAELPDAMGGISARGLTDEAGLPLDLCPRIQRIEYYLHKEVLGVTATLRGFAKPPGRKVMLLLSGGWPNSVRDFLSGSNAPQAAQRCVAKGPAIFRPIYDTANLLGYTLYPVDVPGPSRGGVSAELAGGPGVVSANPGDASGFAADNTGLGGEFEVHGTLLRLAEETGGEAMIDTARLAALDRVVDDTRSYYWLGFTPDWQGDDKGHKIDLEVLRPGLKVRSRQGFNDLSRSTEVSFMVESALLFDNLPGARPLEVRLGEPGKGKQPKVPIEVVIPMDAITMLPERDHYVARLELRVAALDKSGDENEIAAIPVVLEGPEPPPGSHATYETAIKLRREPHDLVIALYDPLSDTLLAAKKRFEP